MLTAVRKTYSCIGMQLKYYNVYIDTFRCISDITKRGSCHILISHFHHDHIQGIPSKRLVANLSQPLWIYCSHKTATMLQTYAPHLGPFLTPQHNFRWFELSHFTPEISSTVSHRKLYTCIIPARHCPGSVMFAFKEVNAFRIRRHRPHQVECDHPGVRIRFTLYTGDFTLHPNTYRDVQTLQRQIIRQHPRFYNIHRGIWQRIYFDDTFRSIRQQFPTFTETVDVCANMILSICKHDKKSVFCDIRTYGHEVIVIKAISY
jgi:ribonuclease BN (tRNA processing enzyme)